MGKKRINKSLGKLGELETEIMEVMWGLEKASVREVLNKLKKKRKIAYTTVMTVMARLYEKGILRRELSEKGAYHYMPISNRQNFLATASKEAIDRLVKEFGNVAVVQFIDIIENGDHKNSKEWQEKLKKIK